MDRIRIHTYRQVWRQEHLIYQIERFRLPFPVSLRQAGIFLAITLVMSILGKLPGLEQIPAIIRNFLLPGLVTWFLTRQRLDGKLPHRWVYSRLVFLMAPKCLNRFKPLQHQRSIRFSGSIAYRQKG